MLYSLVPTLIFTMMCLTNLSFARVSNDDEILPRRGVLKPHIKGRILVKVKPEVSVHSLEALEHEFGAKSIKTFSLVEGLQVFEFDPAIDVSDAIKTFSANEAVIYAEPDYLYFLSESLNATVNDPEYPKQWSLENKSQTGGKADADINAELMWNYQAGGENVVIGVIDTGLDYTHPDLVPNLWNNPGEIPMNGKDDDQNTFVDDVFGINAIKNNGVPMDDNMHGTHVAGTIGAKGNNGVGITGVAQKVRIAACKFLSKSGAGSVSDAVECMQYFAALKTRTTNPVNIVATNNSWGGGGSSDALLDAIKAHEKLGILFIAAAGNDGDNNDVTENFPANYKVSNIISVAATDHNDRLAPFSNYGKMTVHVAAPGVKILSTVLGHKYGELSGTSMATPHVSGLVALIAAHFKTLGYLGIKNLVLTGGQKIDAAAATTITGRRIRGADTNGTGSLTCSNQTLAIRNEPVGTVHRIAVKKSLLLTASHLNCAENAGPLTVYQGTLGRIVLTDDGKNGDVTANDGIYSNNWTPSVVGVYELKFSDNDIVTVTVFDKDKFHPYEANDQVPYEYLTISGQRLRAGDDTMHPVTAPFPINFGGYANGFVDLYVSSNGTISFTDRNQPGYLNRPLPTTNANTLVAPFWDDLATAIPTSDIYVEVLGSAPSRKFVIEWWRFKQAQSLGTGAFQVVFFENSPNFQFNYLDTNLSNPNYDYGASATIGVQVKSDSSFEYSFNSPRVSSSKSIFFSLNNEL